MRAHGLAIEETDVVTRWTVRRCPLLRRATTDSKRRQPRWTVNYSSLTLFLNDSSSTQLHLNFNSQSSYIQTVCKVGSFTVIISGLLLIFELTDMEYDSAVMKQCSSGSFLELTWLAGCSWPWRFEGRDIGGRQWLVSQTEQVYQIAHSIYTDADCKCSGVLTPASVTSCWVIYWTTPHVPSIPRIFS